MNKVYKADCLEALQKLEQESIDIVITSPPYNIGIKYGKYEDKKPRDQYISWIFDIFKEVKRVLKPNGQLFLNIGYTNVDPWIDMEIAMKLKEIYELQNNITWVKSISIGDVSTGHFKPINSKRFINPTNEKIFHFTKSGKVELDRLSIGVPYTYKCNLKEREKKKNKTGELKPDKRCKGNSWFIPYETVCNKKSKGYHPATFPKKLVEQCLLVSGIKTGTVLDPFAGTGTTLVVAKELSKKNEYNFSGIGYDIDPGYVEYANQQLV